MRLHPDDRVDASNIEHLPIAVTGSNMMVPLDQIATITMGKGPAQIQHLDGKRMVAVSANAQGRASGEVTADAMKIAKAIDFPTGYGITLGGASRDQQEVFSEMFIALIMGIALMYLVLVMQFGSFTAPLPVMLSLPLSLIGVVRGAARHARHAQPDELHRRHHADGPGGEERDPAARLRAQGRGAGRRPRGGADARRAACACARS